MCVAAIIFKPVLLEHLECMENDNPHGAGIAWLQDGAIRFMRGLTAKDIHQLQTDEVMSYPYLMHYRWATHGDKVPELTHPFPIGPRALLGELSGSAQSVLIHNGTWNSYERNATKYLNRGNYEIPEEIINTASDTAVAAWLMADNPDILDEVLWATAVAEIVAGPPDEQGNSKKTMEITTRGTWSDKDGNWYSNLNWVPWAQSYTSFPVYNGGAYKDGGYDAYWAAWERLYRRGMDTDSLDYPDTVRRRTNGADIDWEEYYKAPFALRELADKDVTFDEYVERFKRGGAISLVPDAAVKDGRKSSDEMSWDDYLVSKYGPEVAAQIKSDCFPPVEEDVDERIDVETISEDFETVNAILDRQMRGKWGA